MPAVGNSTLDTDRAKCGHGSAAAQRTRLPEWVRHAADECYHTCSQELQQAGLAAHVAETAQYVLVGVLRAPSPCFPHVCVTAGRLPYHA